MKKDDTPRICINYREVNRVTTKDSFPLPIIEDMFDTLAEAGWFHSLNLFSRYYQVAVADEDKHKTECTSHSGLLNLTLCHLASVMPHHPLVN